MFVPVWLAMFGLAVGATAVWALLERRIPLTTTTAIGAWGWLAFRSEQIEVVTSGIIITREAPWIQLFALWMLLLNAIGLMLWYFGDFPPSEADEPVEQGAQAPR